MTASYFSGYCSEGGDRDRSMSGDSGGLRFRPTRRIYQQQSTTDLEPVGLSWIPETTASEMSPVTIVHNTEVEEETFEEVTTVRQEEGYLGVPAKPSVSTSGSADTLIPSAPSSPSNLSAVTLVGSTGSGEKCDEIQTEFQYGKVPSSPLPERVVPKRPPRTIEQQAALIEAPPTVTKIQSPKVPVETKPKQPEVKTGIMKSPPITTTTKSLCLTTSTVITTSMISSGVVTQKTTISPPSIGVTFDRYKQSIHQPQEVALKYLLLSLDDRA